MNEGEKTEVGTFKYQYVGGIHFVDLTLVLALQFPRLRNWLYRHLIVLM